MKTLIRKCEVCGNYTMEETCPKCHGRTVQALPPRFSPEDKYGRYRLLVLYGDDINGSSDNKNSK